MLLVFYVFSAQPFFLKGANVNKIDAKVLADRVIPERIAHQLSL